MQIAIVVKLKIDNNNNNCNTWLQNLNEKFGNRNSS